MEVIKAILLFITMFCLPCWSTAEEPILEEIRGYHFHTYFFQDNLINREEALFFRDEIQLAINIGVLAGCRLNVVNLGPRGPHPIGSYETCCNKTAISPALSWFMQNHGNLSILLHALTRWEVEDHTSRAMFLGPKVPLDLSALKEDLGENLDHCLPIQESDVESNLIDPENENAAAYNERHYYRH